MNRNYFLGIVFAALACLLLIFFSVGKEVQAPISQKPIAPPPLAPYKTYITGVGIIEASSGNISVGTTLNRTVKKILVSEGHHVDKGEALIQLENSDLVAALKEQQFAYESAQKRLEKMQSLPRAEDLAIAEATLKGSEAELNLSKDRYNMVIALGDSRAISQEEKMKRLFDYQQAQAKWQQTQADYDKTKAGAWKPDLEIAELEVNQARANLKRTQAELDRTIIRSPIEGTVLQIKIHEGESPQDPLKGPMMVLGNTQELYLRVSINQLDIPFFHADEPATAYLQGDARAHFPLELVRVEPYLVPKQNFTNEITETINTNVLQILYKIKNKELPLFVGQQMDVFIATKYPS